MNTGAEAAGAKTTRTARVPLHEQVVERILQRIILGDWSEGHVLPPEPELARQLKVSPGTVRRAMAELVRQSVVIRRPRSGTVVTGRTPNHTLERFYHYYRLHRADGALINTDARTLDTTLRPATAHECAQLKLDAEEPVIQIHRLRIADGRPVMIDTVVMARRRAPDFPLDRDATPPLLYKWLLETHGLRIAAAREHVRAVLATAEVSRLLDLDPGRPHALLEIRETAFDARNTPILSMHHIARTEDHHYVNEVR